VSVLGSTLAALGLVAPAVEPEPVVEPEVVAEPEPADPEPTEPEPSPEPEPQPRPAPKTAPKTVEGAGAVAEPVAPEQKPESVPVVQMDNTAGAPIPASRPSEFPDRKSRANQGRVARRILSSRGGGDEQEGTGAGDWGFDFHGYFRAPMRLGFGERAERMEGQHERTIHAPVIPDDQYLGYQYTLHNPRDWAELYFSYGNKVATGTISIQGFNFTDAAWKENNAQFGIAQGFVTLTPNLRNQHVRLLWKIGSFDNRYGGAGRYDAGELDTYIMGRTHAMGEAGEVQFLIKDFTVSVEHGVGATRPDPRVFNTARFTLLHHGHLGFAYQDKIEVGAHYLQALAREEDRDGEMNVNPPDGSMTVLGPDIRFDWGRIGYLYAGFSYIMARHAGVVGPSIEVIHSKGGGQFTFGIVDNYLNGPTNTSGGNGNIYSALGQFEHSVQRILKGKEFWGEGMDLKIKLYGMINKVDSDDPDADGLLKIKYGADLIFSALKWFGLATRYDRVQPNNRIPEQSFSVFSPRLFFRTNWITREEISVQYSRYFYNERTCSAMGDPELCVQPPSASVPPEGFGSTTGNQDAGNRGAPTRIPDQDVFMIKATMWW
jgi:hypothetical protein